MPWRQARESDFIGSADIRAWVFADKGIISKYGIPEKILFIDSIPKTSVGKINKKELRERYGDM